MTTVGSFHAKTHLPELLRRVMQGETVQITKRGVPIAILAPVAAASEIHDPKEAAQQIRKLRKGVTLGSLKLRNLVDEGRA
jgi:prevent-host-death family protein